MGLLYGPQWVHNRQLDALVDRVLGQSLPEGTRLADDEVQASVALRTNGNECDYRVRFNLQTDLSQAEVVKYYESAKIVGIDGGGLQIIVWSPSITPPYPLNFARNSMIVEVQDNGHDPSWDWRCW
jgi:hypothetical protein